MLGRVEIYSNIIGLVPLNILHCYTFLLLFDFLSGLNLQLMYICTEVKWIYCKLFDRIRCVVCHANDMQEQTNVEADIQIL